MRRISSSADECLAPCQVRTRHETSMGQVEHAGGRLDHIGDSVAFLERQVKWQSNADARGGQRSLRAFTPVESGRPCHGRVIFGKGTARCACLRPTGGLTRVVEPASTVGWRGGGNAGACRVLTA